MDKLSRDALVRARIKMNPDAEYPQIHLRRRDTEGGVSAYYRVVALPGQKMIQLEAVPFDDHRSIKRLVLANWSLPRSYAANEWALVELRVEGRRITVSVDGQKLGDAEDDSVTQAGGVGVFAVKNGFLRDIVYVPLDQPASPAFATAPLPSADVATKDAPFVNTLGMRFVPVPILGGPTGGQRVLFSVWDTRVQDYEIFSNETKRAWSRVAYPQGPTHPAVNVSWNDAQLFCQWLTAREQAAGKLPVGWGYRLPSDHEWSCAVDIGADEDPAKLPVEKSAKLIDIFPWGAQWPPPPGAGNYAGEELRPAIASGKYKQVSEVIAGYQDGFVETSPVGTFAANRFGLFDMGGNVWQWCEDWVDAAQIDRTLRGASWHLSHRGRLKSSTRNRHSPATSYDDYGFRCVLAASTPAAGILPKPAPPVHGDARATESAPPGP